MRRALVVGVDNYSFSPLTFGVADAQSMADTLKADPLGFDVEVLLDQDATRRGILQGLSFLRNPGVEIACLYLSGHGRATTYGTFFVTIDGVIDDEGIDVRSIPGLMGHQDTGAKQRLMLYDFCHSGASSSVDNHNTRGQVTTEQLRAAIASSDQGAGAAVIAACQASQLAYEYSVLGHGKLTYHLLEGLKGAAAAAGQITIHGLYDYVCRGFAGDERQGPVWRGDVEGSVVLAAGFPIIGDADGTATRADAGAIKAIEAEARTHLENYHHRWSVSLEEWRERGWASAGVALGELLRWFDRLLRSTPELSQSPVFIQCHQAARGRLSQLANVDLGTSTPNGILTERVGAGAFGSVWRTTQQESPDRAYKIYHPGDLHLSDKLSRFERGFRAMQQLSHHHIVTVHQYTAAPVGFVMDFIDGPNLRTLSPAGSMTTEQQIQMLFTVAEAIQHSHGQGVIHRDIKPENIIAKYDDTTGEWFPYLTDFDLAWFSTATQVTKEGFGAQFYSAPEQFARPNSPEAHAPTVDIYAFGQLMFFSLAGTDPQPLGMGENVQVLTSHLERWTQASAAEMLVTLFRECTESDWRRRTSTFETVVGRLAEALLAMRLPDGRLSAEMFQRELLLAFGGIRDPGVAGEVTSRSGRTSISLRDVRERDTEHQISATVKMSRLDKVLVAGAGTYGEARTRLLKRLDAAMNSVDKGLIRRKGIGEPLTDLELSLTGAPLTREGVGSAHSAISRVLAAFESA